MQKWLNMKSMFAQCSICSIAVQHIYESVPVGSTFARTDMHNVNIEISPVLDVDRLARAWTDVRGCDELDKQMAVEHGVDESTYLSHHPFRCFVLPDVLCFTRSSTASDADETKPTVRDYYTELIDGEIRVAH